MKIAHKFVNHATEAKAKAEAEADAPGTGPATAAKATHMELLQYVQGLVESVKEQVSNSAEALDLLPPRLELTVGSATREQKNQHFQFQDKLAWDVDDNSPDPGLAVFLRKYIPVDMLQIPQKAKKTQNAFFLFWFFLFLC